MSVFCENEISVGHGKDSSQEVTEETLSKVNWQNKIEAIEDDFGVWNQSYQLVPILVADRFEEVLPSGKGGLVLPQISRNYW